MAVLNRRRRGLEKPADMHCFQRIMKVMQGRTEPGSRINREDAYLGGYSGFIGTHPRVIAGSGIEWLRHGSVSMVQALQGGAHFTGDDGLLAIGFFDACLGALQ